MERATDFSVLFKLWLIWTWKGEQIVFGSKLDRPKCLTKIHKDMRYVTERKVDKCWNLEAVHLFLHPEAAFLLPPSKDLDGKWCVTKGDPRFLALACENLNKHTSTHEKQEQPLCLNQINSFILRQKFVPPPHLNLTSPQSPTNIFTSLKVITFELQMLCTPTRLVTPASSWNMITVVFCSSPNSFAKTASAKECSHIPAPPFKHFHYVW